MKKFTIHSVKTKLILISILILIIPLFTLGTFSYYKSVSSLNALGKTNLKNSVEMTIGMIDALDKEVEKGNLSLEDAQEEVKEAILGEKQPDGTRPINPHVDLGEYGYLFVVDEQGEQIASPDLEGENTWENEDHTGVKTTQVIIKSAQSGGGFSDYEFPLPDNPDQIEKKVTYSKLDPNWNWVVVSGTYLLDFNKPAKDLLYYILIVTWISTIISGIVIWLYTNRITKPIKAVTEQMNHLAEG
uniref:cache domain-containing protein n=1 Tax=Lentibacillus saliphilus TaxID=2737028 RepID=UPI001C30EEEB